MPYKVGVSSGWWSIPKSSDLLGLGSKIASVATYGVNFVQADFENTAEFIEPGVINQIEHAVEDLGINWGGHGEIGESLAWETAIEVLWKQSHRRLHQYLDGVYELFIKNGKEKYKPEYINFHASNMPSIGIFVERFRYAGHSMVDIYGRTDWNTFLEENKDVKNWFTRNILLNIYARESGIAFENRERIKQNSLDEILREKFAEIADEEERRKKITEYMSDSNKEKRDEDIFNNVYKRWLDSTSLRSVRGAISFEEFAYAIIAKYLEYNKNNPNEPLWKIFFGGKSMDDLENDWGSNGEKKKFFDEVEGSINLFPEVVAMVACRYIVGHFQKKNLPEFLTEKRKKHEMEKGEKKWEPFFEKTALEKLSQIKVFFAFEPPEILEGQKEGMQRIIHASHIYNLVKASGSPYFRVMIDSEHYVHNNLDPKAEIQNTPSDFGEYVYGYHVGAPKPYHPTHEPIDVGSEAQRWIYVYAYELRKKGFGKSADKPGLILFERGGRPGSQPAEWMRTSVTAIKLIVEQLDKDTDPEKLPDEFFGVSRDGALSPERQSIIIREHAEDPLKGMLSVPEEGYGFLSSAAIAKGKKPEEWKKEELR